MLSLFPAAARPPAWHGQQVAELAQPLADVADHEAGRRQGRVLLDRLPELRQRVVELTLAEEIFRFLRRSFHLSPKSLKPEFEKLLDKLKKQQRNKFETRAFVYLDIISWLESKISNEPVQTVIRKKFLERETGHGKRDA
mgnify:CR=1 FL=1